MNAHIQPGQYASEALASAIEAARQRSIGWLRGMQTPGAPTGVTRISEAHHPERWPGVLLPGSYNAIMALRLLGALDLTPSEVSDLVAWLEGHRLPDGRFRVPGMRDDNVFKKPDLVETWGYIDFHVTNYSLGAVAALKPDREPNLAFAWRFLTPKELGWWLSLRDFRDPWQEGNNVVNLGGCLLAFQRFGSAEERAAARAALEQLFEWHDRLQEPATGFWGVGQHADATQLLHSFAGAMHNFHLWYATGRVLPYQARSVDYVLTLPAQVHSACIDVDAVDLLVHAHRAIDHRRGDIDAWLAELLPALLAFQNPDGGFCDVREGVRRQDGWIGGYEEPQGLSNTFATWFRWIAIAMIADHFWPGRWGWGFRKDVGIGYRAW